MKTYKLIDFSDKRRVYSTFQASNDFLAAEICKVHYNFYYMVLYCFEGRKRLYEVDFRSIFRTEYEEFQKKRRSL